MSNYPVRFVVESQKLNHIFPVKKERSVVVFLVFKWQGNKNASRTKRSTPHE